VTRPIRERWIHPDGVGNDPIIFKRKGVYVMIFIISRKDDIHADFVIKKLEEMNVDFFRLNTECIFNYKLILSPKSARIYNTLSGKNLLLKDIKSVYLRRRSIPEGLLVDKEYRAFIDQQWTCFQKNIWSYLEDKFWISSPAAIDFASDKLRQLRIAEDIGFHTPETLFTNSLTDVIALQKKYEKCIYKPYDGGFLSPDSDKAIYTSIMGENLIESPEKTEQLRICPGIFQPYIEKECEFRITVVGEKVFVARIDSQKSEKTKVDWRRYDFENVSHAADQLPKEEEEKCIELVKRLELRFGAIDMILTPKHEFYFLEINANGQWAWIEVLTGLPISSELAHFLVYHINS